MSMVADWDRGGWRGLGRSSRCWKRQATSRIGSGERNRGGCLIVSRFGKCLAAFDMLMFDLSDLRCAI